MPGRDFTRTFYISREVFEKFGVISGILKNWRKCLACRKVIRKDEVAVKVHKFGELPSFLHPKCALDITNFIETAAKAANHHYKDKCGGKVRVTAKLKGNFRERIPDREIYTCTKCTYEFVVYKEVLSGGKKR